MSDTKKITRPIFIEHDSDGTKDVKELEFILSQVDKAEKSRIEMQISYIKKGIIGEKNIVHELKHCDIPMICIQNLYLTFEDISA